MKKTYIIPQSQVYKLVISQPLLDASIENLGGEAQSTTKGMARGGIFDDSEE